MRIEVKQNILADNSRAADANRERLAGNGVCLVNLMAAPGAGKTSTIIKAIESLRGDISMAVIEGDIASEIDALTIESMDVPAIQINTGGACHLTATMVSQALDHLDLASLDLIIIENVGNLVCPAEFDLGENSRVMISSITEGHDKPQKYPLMFREVDAVLINKVDLLPYCDFDLESFRGVVNSLNPAVQIFELSCRDGAGAQSWCEWLTGTVTRSAAHNR